MCGINGFAGPDVRREDAEDGRRMRDTITHRGPDGPGEAFLEGRGVRAWLGHRRLKVIDLTDAAHQPMLAAGDQVGLTYNGEIYNFRELRRELEGHGHRFTSSGDTEVVLRAYLQWGEDFVGHLDGMFALAVFDGREGRLLLARDRTGKKPLFYSLDGGRLTFGSEIKAIVTAPWVQRRLDPRRLPEYLTFGYVPHPHTLYDGIHQVPPASVVVYDEHGLRPPRTYWDPLPEPGAAPRRADDALLADIRDTFTRATERRMVADVSLGALLSGGVDSSLVVGLMTKAATAPVRTFAIGFADDASFDERGYARMVADHFGTEHTEHTVRADAVALMDRLLWHHDQPYADSSAIPTYLVCEIARRDVTVVLNGDGGDEVFGGYDRFVASALAERLPRGATRIGRAGTRLIPRSHGYFSPRRRAERFLELAESPPRERYQSWIAVMNGDLLAELLPGAGDGDELGSMDACYGRASHLPLLDQIIYANFKTYLPDDLAVKMDRMSMAHSLEARSPFLDTAVIELLAQVRASDKVGLRRVKPLLRRAFWPLLPREIWNRRKHGFGVPVGHWFRGDLREMYADEVLTADARLNELVDPAVVRRLWEEHQAATREHGFRLWTLLTLEHWLRSLERPPETAAPGAAVLAA